MWSLPLFTEMRGIRILGSSDAGFWISHVIPRPDGPGSALSAFEVVGII